MDYHHLLSWTIEILGFSILVALNSLENEAKTTAKASAIIHSLTVLSNRQSCNKYQWESLYEMPKTNMRHYMANFCQFKIAARRKAYKKLSLMEINKASAEIQALSSGTMLSVGSQVQSSVVTTSQKSCCWWNAATQDDNGCWFIFDSEYWNITGILPFTKWQNHQNQFDLWTLINYLMKCMLNLYFWQFWEIFGCIFGMFALNQL